MCGFVVFVTSYLLWFVFDLIVLIYVLVYLMMIVGRTIDVLVDLMISWVAGVVYYVVLDYCDCVVGLLFLGCLLLALTLVFALAFGDCLIYLLFE